MRKKVVLLGSTGSVGRNACKVLELHRDRFELVCAAANTNYKTLLHQCEKLNAGKAIIANKIFFERAKATGAENVFCGMDAMIDAVSADEADIVICAILGSDALLPVLKALECGKTVALASKEVMLTAGKLVMETAKKHGGKIIPVDSEHSALFQCLAAHDKKDLKSLVLTCSGGPFRGFTAEKLAGVTAADALKHPVWSMGRKITVDSASLMNKALEVAEAAYLFECDEKDIKVIIHPEGIIHSLVEFNDNSMVGLFSNPSMELPIQYALTYPSREEAVINELDLVSIAKMSFYAPDTETFPLLALAKKVWTLGGSYGSALNGANEEAVGAFLRGRIGLPRLFELVEEATLSTGAADDSFESVFETDVKAREYVRERL